MTRSQKATFIKQYIANVNSLATIDSQLKAVVPFSKRKGISVAKIMEKLVATYKQNWYSNLSSEMSDITETKLADGAYYSKLADLAGRAIKNYLNEDVEWSPATINELRINIRFYISNSTKGIDIYTGIFNSYYTQQLVRKIRETCDVHPDNESKLQRLIEENKLSHEIATIIEEEFPDTEMYNTAMGTADMYTIRSDLMFMDLPLRLEYEEQVCDAVKGILEPYTYTLTRSQAKELLGKEEDAQYTIAERIESDISMRDCSISLLQDYETLYYDIAKNSNAIIRDLDITSLPSEIIEDAILRGEVTKELEDYAMNPPMLKAEVTEEF